MSFHYSLAYTDFRNEGYIFGVDFPNLQVSQRKVQSGITLISTFKIKYIDDYVLTSVKSNVSIIIWGSFQVTGNTY